MSVFTIDSMAVRILPALLPGWGEGHLEKEMKISTMKIHFKIKDKTIFLYTQITMSGKGVI